MFTLRDFKSPETLDEAYELLMKSKMNKILGGCHFLTMLGLICQN